MKKNKKMERLSPKKEISCDIFPNLAIAVPQKKIFHEVPFFTIKNGQKWSI